jgi:hypothetical protein
VYSIPAGRGSASKIVHAMPMRAKSSAAASPAGPDPMIAEPERGRRNWQGEGKAEEQKRMYENRRRAQGDDGGAGRTPVRGQPVPLRFARSELFDFSARLRGKRLRSLSTPASHGIDPPEPHHQTSAVPSWQRVSNCTSACTGIQYPCLSRRRDEFTQIDICQKISLCAGPFWVLRVGCTTPGNSVPVQVTNRRLYHTGGSDHRRTLSPVTTALGDCS